MTDNHTDTTPETTSNTPDTGPRVYYLDGQPISAADLRPWTQAEIDAAYEAVRPQTIADIEDELSQNTLAMLKKTISLQGQIDAQAARIDKLAATVRELAGLAGIDPGDA